MAASDAAEPWLDDFTLVFTRDHLRRHAYSGASADVFTGSKPIAAVWAALWAAAGGALGGLLVSSALWSSFLFPPLWLAGLIAGWALALFTTRRLLGSGQVSFLVGWCLFWGILIGLCAMWGAEREASGTAYAIAGGLGFLIGITGGVYEPPDMGKSEALFTLAMVLAPLGAILTVWGYRNLGGDPTSMADAALTGAAAGLILLAPQMVLIAAYWDNQAGLRRLAATCLHGDDRLDEAIGLLDRALKLRPDDPDLYHLRGFAHAAAGNEARAEADWSRHDELAPKSIDVLVARGMLELRKGDADAALAPLEAAAKAKPKDKRALAALALAQHRRGDPETAITLYQRATKGASDAWTMTRLAEAQLDAGKLKEALETVDVAIDECDSIHARSWLVRARARDALGDLDGAAADYQEAYLAGDEPDIGKSAEQGMDEARRRGANFPDDEDR